MFPLLHNHFKDVIQTLLKGMQVNFPSAVTPAFSTLILSPDWSLILLRDVAGTS